MYGIRLQAELSRALNSLFGVVQNIQFFATVSLLWLFFLLMIIQINKNYPRAGMKMPQLILYDNSTKQNTKEVK